MKNCYIVILIFLTACSNPYAGFKEVEDGLYFKLKEIGTESSPLKKADFILVVYDFCEDSDCDNTEYRRELLINLADSHINRDFWSGFHIEDRFTMMYENKTSGFKKIVFNS